MKTFDNNEEQIKESLEQMPEVKDNMNKDVLYQRISSEFNKERQPKKNKKLVLIPIFSTVMVLLLLVIIIPSMMNNTMFQSSSENSNADKAMDNAGSNESMKAREESSELKQEDSASSSADSDSGVLMMDTNIQSYVIHSTSNKTIIYSALADRQSQYVVPLSLVVPKTDNAGKYYKQLNTYLNEQKWGLSDYMFPGTEFQLNKQSNQVNIKLPEDFSITSGAQANMFQGLLTTMFTPYQINKAVFSQQVNLGPTGKVKELSLKSSKVIYKRYQLSENRRNFLVQIPVDEKSDIKTALTKMRNTEESYNVYQSIPDYIDFSVETDDELLRLNFDDEKMVLNNQETITMIEAILMTVKSYGYQDVLFTNYANEIIGPYNLSEPIKVPDGVNPIRVDS
ncbi:hypothetical protein [Virgibacillus sp. JSM 102003]|uniref:hypothetical protein n=1 Tax=Virgibacillus sp. JSM 102003 TaxID=1562108 RepID=UPI0035C0A3B6